MAEPQYAHNGTIDPETGFLENNGYGYPFDAERKKQFIEVFIEKGLGLYRTCQKLGISHHTIFNHLRKDPVFKTAFEEAKLRYGEELESISKENARNPKSVIERIFQLKSIFPERYADQRSNSPMNVSISIDGKAIENILKREKVIDAELVSRDQIEDKK